jgi:hypothetical protein
MRAMPAGERPVPWEPEPYPPGVAKAALLALEEAGAADRSGVSARVLEIMAVLPGSGVDRELLHAAGEAGVLAKNRRRPGGERRTGGRRASAAHGTVPAGCQHRR